MTAGTSVLVTGGAGFIGSHACKALKAAGLVPVAFDNLTCASSTQKEGRYLEILVKDKYVPMFPIRFAASFRRVAYDRWLG